MTLIKQTADTSATQRSSNYYLRASITASLFIFNQPVLAHVEYYDLNQGKQITDLTAAGIIKATEHYGSTSLTVRTLNPDISPDVDLPLDDPAFWNPTYQHESTTFNFIFDPATGYGSAIVDISDGTGNGWYKGTTPTLGNSHDLNWFNFRLYQPAQVTITWNMDKNGKFLDSGFTLYRGFLTFQGHDDLADNVNPNEDFPPYARIQNLLDSADAPLDVQGIASAYRNTVTGPTFVGQFNALANWGQSNESGNWSNVLFKQAVNSKLGESLTSENNTKETLIISLPAGNYSIGAAGASATNTNTLIHGQLTFSATAIPDGCPIP